MSKSTPIVGWIGSEPVPDDHRFAPHLSCRQGRLFFEDIELAALFESGVEPAPGLPDQALPCPLEVALLPVVSRQVQAMCRAFEEARSELGYSGDFFYTYASKANTAEEVVRTTLQTGAHHEMSSNVDVEIVRIMHAEGLIDSSRLVLANGFKPAGSDYAENLVRLRQEGLRVVPILDAEDELESFLDRGVEFELGIRLKYYGAHTLGTEGLNSRFGIPLDRIGALADRITSSGSARLCMLHAMMGSQIECTQTFADGLRPALELFAELAPRHRELRMLNFGGGVPARHTLDFEFDLSDFARRLLQVAAEESSRAGVNAPDIVGEFGRYTTAEHACHLFRMITTRHNESALPWKIVDGSIMTSFPDTWALGEHFVCLPLNHLDRPFRRVQLGGITCDSDDVYPPKGSPAELWLPDIDDDLYVGFFQVGAYQEMLGGVRGSKHCVLPEATELLIEKSTEDRYRCTLLEGHSSDDILRNLGYRGSERRLAETSPPDRLT